MGTSTYLDFTLRLFEDQNAGLRVQILASPESQEAPIDFVTEEPVTYIPLASEIDEDIRGIAEVIGLQGIDEEARHAMRDLGHRLRRMLFPEPIWEYFLTRLQRAKQRHAVLRLRLLIESKGMASWPYEYLYVVEWEPDSQLKRRLLHQWGRSVQITGTSETTSQVASSMQSGFIALDPSISILRLGSLKSDSLPLVPAEELQVLVVYCNLQKDTATTVYKNGEAHSVQWKYLESLDAELKSVRSALGKLEELNPRPMTVKVLKNPTPVELLGHVRQGQYHVLVYLGHGYDNADGCLGANWTRGLVLDDGYQRHQYLEADKLADALAATTVRLVVLNACETMRTACALAEKGLTTIAMHFLQPDVAGLLLGEAFWRAVARHGPIEVCLAQAREILVHTLTAERPEWGNAALIMQSHDGVLLARPQDLERANYLRVLERRFPSGVDDDLADRVIRLVGESEAAEGKLGEALATHSKLVIQARDVEKISTGLVRWAGAAEKQSVLEPGTLPIQIWLDRWVASSSLANFLSSSLSEMGLSADFGEVLLQHVRNGRAVLVFESLVAQDFPRETIRRIAELASGIGHASRLLVVSKPVQNAADLRSAGFAIATLARSQDAEPPLEVCVWVEPAASDQVRDPIVEKLRVPCRVGDAFTVHFRANSDCYLTLVDYGTSGNIYILFPNAIHTNSYLPGKVTRSVPDPAHKFPLRMGGPPGLERIRAIATREPVTGLHMPSKGIFAQCTSHEIEVLNKIVQGMSPADRAEAECEVQVRE